MKRRNYKFTNKKNPWQACASVILGVISLVAMGIVIYLSFRTQGGTKPGYGATGLLSVIFTLVGVILGLVSLRETEELHFLGWVGIVVNLLVLFASGYLFSIGMR